MKPYMATPSIDTWSGSTRSSHYPPHKEAPPGVYTQYIPENNNTCITSLMKNKNNNYLTGNSKNQNTARQKKYMKIQTYYLYNTNLTIHFYPSCVRRKSLMSSLSKINRASVHARCSGP